eukprot:jgi/Hompol1/1135/HPOL_001064-RA
MLDDSNTFGYLLPAYSSYKAIKSEDDELIQHYIKYWIVMAAVAVVGSVADRMIFWYEAVMHLNSYRFPLYYEVKMLFVLWLSLPYTQVRMKSSAENGATYIYSKHIEPMLAEREQQIDRGLYRSKSVIQRASIEWGKQGISMFRRAVLESLMTDPPEPEADMTNRAAQQRQRKHRATNPSSQFDATFSDEDNGSHDASHWIASERSRLAARLRELDALSDDLGDNPPPADTAPSSVTAAGFLQAVTGYGTKPKKSKQAASGRHSKQSSNGSEGGSRRTSNAAQPFAVAAMDATLKLLEEDLGPDDYHYQRAHKDAAGRSRANERS